MGSEIPKQFLELGGKAILHFTIERFIEAIPGIKVITVLPEAHVAYWKKYCYEHNFSYPQTIVNGGITRFHSVKNGLLKVQPDSIVAVHDGVRPLVSVDLIRKLFSEAENCSGVVPVIPCVNTLKVLEMAAGPDRPVSLVPVPGMKADRSRLFGAQTPQVFQSEILKEAYTQAFDTSFTDDASVVEAKGISLSYMEGERYNIKITTRDDLMVATALTELCRMV